jgi:hypothetical protein
MVVRCHAKPCHGTAQAVVAVHSRVRQRKKQPSNLAALQVLRNFCVVRRLDGYVWPPGFEAAARAENDGPRGRANGGAMLLLQASERSLLTTMLTKLQVCGADNDYLRHLGVHCTELLKMTIVAVFVYLTIAGSGCRCDGRPQHQRLRPTCAAHTHAAPQGK